MARPDKFDKCPGVGWDNGRRQCPHDCGVNCKRNAAVQREHGKKLAKRMDNLSRSDLHWLAGTGPYGQ